jgi:hydroxymethylbilane synthase
VSRTIIIGTRGSDLALWQANYTSTLLTDQGHQVEIKIIETSGDRTQQWEAAFDKLEGKGFFTKELEDALLDKSIDLAVHSHKDLPTTQPDGLMVGGVSKREDPAELLIMRKEFHDPEKKYALALHASVGTSSSRRKSQLLAFRPDVKIADIRGNVPTRIRKLREGQYDAILLAAAGIERLEPDLSDLHVERLDPHEFIPAPAQGVLAWQIREEDTEVMEAIDGISNLDSLVITNLERQVLSLFDGGCQLPLGVYCETDEADDDRLKFRVWVSKAADWKSQPAQLYFETFDTDGLADRITDQINNIRGRKVFITRNCRDDDYFVKALSQLGYTVEGKSLIEFKPIRIKELPKTDWIFFSSKHAVKYFFLQKPEIGAVKFGCIGTGTSAALRAYGHRADFIGASTDIKLVGKQFSSRVGSGKVLFPIGRGSLQSIQWQMVKRENVFNLEVYATLQNNVTVGEEFEIIVFTSPSNADAYFALNKFSKAQRAVAMGDSTGGALQKQKIRNYVMPQTFDDYGLVQAVLGVEF